MALVTALPLALMSCQSGDPAPASPGPAPERADPAPVAADPGPAPVATDPTPVAVAPAPAVTNSADASTLDGVYTPAQAARGAQVFDNVCSECHKTEEWADDGFRSRWQDESVFGFWYYIYEQMPNGAPPYTLTRVQVTDVLTYILELNGLPVGPAELGTDDDSIDKFWLRWAPQG
jgi:mono/diheme cytochrome c family protein